MTKELTFISDNNAKAVKAFIGKTLKDYASVKQRLHIAACVAIFQAQQYGNHDYLNMMHSGLSVNDQTALRMWVAKVSTLTVTDNSEGGGEIEVGYIAFNQKDGFRVKKNTQGLRKDYYSPAELTAMQPFYAKDVNKKPEPMTTAAILAWLASAASTLEKKQKKLDDDQTLDPAIIGEVKKLSAMAERAAAQITVQ